MVILMGRGSFVGSANSTEVTPLYVGLQSGPFSHVLPIAGQTSPESGSDVARLIGAISPSDEFFPFTIAVSFHCSGTRI